MEIKVYLKTGCPWCIGLTNFLKEKGINYDEKNVTESPELFEEMVKLSGQSKAPVAIINGVMLADTDKDAVEKYLTENKLI